MSKIVVIGSTNLDIVARVSHLPLPGETVGDGTLFEAYGGKGANQAVAAIRTGGNVSFVGCVGNDAAGMRMIENLNNEGINTDNVRTVDGVPSGTALIFVDENGENSIVVAPGANNSVSTVLVDSIEKLIRSADIIILQLEIPYDTVKYICKLAHKLGVKVLLNTAPGREIEDDILSTIDYLVLNETELEIISKTQLVENNLELLTGELLKKGVKNVIVTLGSKGCYATNGYLAQYIKSFSVEAVDSTAAGDTFCGALAADILKNGVLLRAIRFANAAAALAVKKMGAQPSIPYLKDIELFLSSQN